MTTIKFSFLPLVLAQLLSLSVFAAEMPTQGSNDVTQTSVSDNEKGKSRWMVEGSVQAHSVAAEASPWIGIAAQYRILNSMNIGIRGFLPVSKTVDTSTYEIQADPDCLLNPC